ncbi:MAG: PEP-CTERM sorting domain-containing protein [Oceanipulchritudo sp.]
MQKTRILLPFLLAAFQMDAAVVNAYWSFGETGIAAASFDGTTTVTAETWTGTPVVTSTGSEDLLSTSPALAFTAYDGIDYAAGAALAWNTNSTGNSFTLALDMTNLEDLQMRFDYRKRLATTFTAFSAIEYSVNGGAFTTAFSSPALTDSTNFFSLEYADLDFSSIAAIEDQSNVQIRFSFADMPGTSSSFRIDNLQLTAVAVPEPGTYALVLGLLAAGWIVVRRRR